MRSPPSFFCKLPLAFLTGGLLVMGAMELPAALAPRSQKQLQAQSELIVTGKVVAVESRVQKSRVERAFGIHRDKVFTLTIKVAFISKGTGAKSDEEIRVVAWQPVVRIPRLPGPQGHGPIPGKGDTVTMYLKWNKAEKLWEPLL
ncbi:MAG: hypothetical protein GY899_17765, partial [Verrucomicrobiaceae bacterium]|nr:hypothetical protein [Verrucomicrobiaceae bacterium]